MRVRLKDWCMKTVTVHSSPMLPPVRERILIELVVPIVCLQHPVQDSAHLGLTEHPETEGRPEEEVVAARRLQ